MTQTITGTAGDDRLDGAGKADLILGLGGDDVLQGFGGDDSLAGGDGDDLLSGGSGDDTLDGGAGADSMSGGSGDDVILIDHVQKFDGLVTPLADLVDGGSGFDTLSFAECGGPVVLRLDPRMEGANTGISNIEHFIATAFDDQINGSSGFRGVYDGLDGADTITSGRRHDQLDGGGGDDRLSGSDHAVVNGGEGDDQLFANFFDTLAGGSGDDYLLFSQQGDVLTGGAGADTFRVGFITAGTPNEITDLAAEDTIDLLNLDANTGVAGDQAFVLVGHLDGHAGQAALRYDASADVTRLQLDQDGDGRADITLLLDGDQTGFTHFIL